MKFKDWVEITKGIDEFNIYDSWSYYEETKDLMLTFHGEREINKIVIHTYDEGSWVEASIYLK